MKKSKTAKPSVDDAVNVFIDCSIFYQNNFAFNLGGLQYVALLANSANVRLILTEITIEEIKKKLMDELHIAGDAIRKLRKKEGRILQNVPTKQKCLDNLDINKLHTDLVAGLNEFIAQTKAIVLDYEGLSAKVVFRKYFTTKPPFGPGEKKCEFPDAFVIEALLNWSEKNKAPVHVIADDNDFKRACDGTKLIYWKSIPEFINLVLSETSAVAKALHKQLYEEEWTVAFEERFESELPRQVFYVDDDLDADVENVSVDTVAVRSRDILEVDEEEGTAIVQLAADVALTLLVAHVDPELSVYDPEEGKFIGERTSSEIETEESYEAEAVIQYDKKTLKIASITRFSIASEDVAVSLFTNDL